MTGAICKCVSLDDHLGNECKGDDANRFCMYCGHLAKDHDESETCDSCARFDICGSGRN